MHFLTPFLTIGVSGAQQESLLLISDPRRCTDEPPLWKRQLVPQEGGPGKGTTKGLVPVPWALQSTVSSHLRAL